MRKEQFFLLTIIVFFGGYALLNSNKFLSKRISIFPSPTPYLTIPEKQTNPQEITLAPAASNNIEVLSPRGGDSIKSGFAVKGNARVFENVVSIRLLDSLGNVLVQTNASANAPDVGKFGPFEEVLKFQSDDSSGTLEVYQVSAKDGSEIDKVTIPLQFN